MSRCLRPWHTQDQTRLAYYLPPEASPEGDIQDTQPRDKHVKEPSTSGVKSNGCEHRTE